MSTSLVVSNSIHINASAEKVWDALVNPAETKKYMFGCEAMSNWKVGSPLDWKGEFEGKEMIFVKGFVIAIEPCSMLKYTVFDPNSTMEDIPVNYLNVTYEVKPENNGTLLVVSQDGFEQAADGEKRYQDVYNNGLGWSPILEQIRNSIEAH